MPRHWKTSRSRFIWDGQVQAAGYQAIVAGTSRLEAAQRFVEFATSTQSLANITDYISYAPLRRSSQALVDTHLDTGIEMAPHLPDWPATPPTPSSRMRNGGRTISTT